MFNEYLLINHLKKIVVKKRHWIEGIRPFRVRLLDCNRLYNIIVIHVI